MNIYIKIQLTVTLLLSTILGVLGQTQSAIDLKGHLINGVSQFSSGEFSEATTSFSNGSTLEEFEDIAAYNLRTTDPVYNSWWEAGCRMMAHRVLSRIHRES